MDASEILASLSPSPGVTRNGQLLDAIDAGALHVEWGWLSWEMDGHTIEVEVGLAPLAIGSAVDWVWFPLTHPLAQHAADSLGAIVATAHICDRNAEAADVWVKPQTQDPAGPTRTTANMLQHHRACLAELDRMHHADVSGLRITGVGKTHVTSRRVEPAKNRGKSCFVGFYTRDKSQGTTSVEGVHAIQGGRYYESLAHGLHFDNYPTGLTRLARYHMRIDGVTCDIRDVLLDPETSYLVTGYEQGSALKYARHPAVPARQLDPEPMGQPWRNPRVTFGDRVVAWYQAMKARGVREVPMGSNTGPEIAKWFATCTRLRDGVESPIGITRGPWCVVTFCAALRAATLDGQPEVFPHDRVSGFELQRDGIELGIFRPVELLLDGSVRMEPGDGVLLSRGDPGGWERHQCIVLHPPEPGGMTFTTLGGNEEDQIRKTERRLDDEQLLGIFEMPNDLRTYDRKEQPDLADHIEQATAELVREVAERHGALTDEQLRRSAGFYSHAVILPPPEWED